LSSGEEFNLSAGHRVMAMVTSARHQPWPLDVPVRDLGEAGLPAPSVIRMKLFTLDHRFVAGRIGSLSRQDRSALRQSLNRLFPALDKSA
jgi:mRNA interferase MazF